MKHSLLIGTLFYLTACSTGKKEHVVLNFTDDILLSHTPVLNQGRTQTCWAYTMASLLESDILAKSSDTLRISVMYAVRKKYMSQFDAYYYSKGKEEIRGGSLGHSFLNVVEKDGMVPYEHYVGRVEKDKYHDHRPLLKELRRLAEKSVEEKNLPLYRREAEVMLDDYMGKVPEHFVYGGKEYTPRSFADSLKHQARYIELTSFTHHPFYTWFSLEVPDNWEHSKFYNVPIDSLEAYVDQALRNGQTVAWDGDTSEDGFMPHAGMAVYPDSVVTQQDRQKGFEQFETTDDHMMHIIGMAHDESGKFYYILKNSWGRIGPYKGLIYMSREYFRAKTVSVVLPCFPDTIFIDLK